MFELIMLANGIKTKKTLGIIAFFVLVFYWGINADFSAPIFSAVNLAIMIISSLVSRLAKKRFYLSAFCPLIYSFLIDTFDWFYFPTSQNYFIYILNGLLWNSKILLFSLTFCMALFFLSTVKKEGVYENSLSGR